MKDLKDFVVVYNKKMNARHYCSRKAYEYASSLTGYDWELEESFDTEEECEDHVNACSEQPSDELDSMTVKELQEKAAEMGLPEAEWKKLKKADLIEYLSSH